MRYRLSYMYLRCTSHTQHCVSPCCNKNYNVKTQLGTHECCTHLVCEFVNRQLTVTNDHHSEARHFVSPNLESLVSPRGSSVCVIATVLLFCIQLNSLHSSASYMPKISQGCFAWLMFSDVAASRVHLSGAAHAALTQFPGYSTEVRGETFIN